MILDLDDGVTSQLSMSLGSGVSIILEITNAYAMIANGGIEIQPKIISSVYSKEGKIIFNTSNKICNDCRLKNISNNNIKVPKIINKNEIYY